MLNTVHSSALRCIVMYHSLVYYNVVYYAFNVAQSSKCSVVYCNAVHFTIL